MNIGHSIIFSLFTFSILFGVFFIGTKNTEAAILQTLRPTSNNLGLVGLWSFNGPDVTDKVYDRSGQDNHGTFIGGATSTAKVIGKIGQAMTFDGSNDCVRMGSPSSLQITGAVTISAWINPRSSGLNRLVAGRGVPAGSASAKNYLLYDNGTNQFRFYLVNDATNSILSSITANNAAPNGKWTHLVGTYNGTDTTVMYVNGVQVDTDTIEGFGALNTTGNNFQVGGSSGCSSATIDGSIDDVRIYNRALSATDVKRLYNSGSAKQNTSQNDQLSNGLVGMWSLDGPDVTDKIYDRSGQDNHGTFIGGATSTAKVIGKIGQAMTFDGVDDYINTNNLWTDLVTSGTMSFSVWAKRTSGTADSRVVHINKTDAREHLGIGATDKWRAHFRGANPVILNSNVSVELNKWTHIVVTLYDNTDVVIYVDGVLTNTSSGATVSSISGLNKHGIIGALNNAGTRTHFFPGIIDDVRIYNRALSATEVKQLYNIGR